LQTVYIIDDDVSVQRALMRLMLSAGYSSATFSSVDAFLQSDFKQENVRIVTDVHMPGILALKLPQILRQIGIDIPVIYLTADYSGDTRERVRQAGGCGYFAKPVDDSALLDMIRWTSTDCACS
jgi:FixJ family two-component response regulator